MIQPIPDPGARELRKFGLLFGFLFALFLGLLLPSLHGWRWRVLEWPLWVGAVFWVWALVLPATLVHFYRLWMRVGMVLGWINTRIILAVFFYLIVTPIALVMRLRGYDPMRRRWQQAADSYRQPSRKSPPKSMEAPY